MDEDEAVACSASLLENTAVINARKGPLPVRSEEAGEGYTTADVAVRGGGPGAVPHNGRQDAKVLEQGGQMGVRPEPISKSCEITQADNLNRRQRLSRKAQCFEIEVGKVIKIFLT